MVKGKKDLGEKKYQRNDSGGLLLHKEEEIKERERERLVFLLEMRGREKEILEASPLGLRFSKP